MNRSEERALSSLVPRVVLGIVPEFAEALLGRFQRRTELVAERLFDVFSPPIVALAVRDLGEIERAWLAGVIDGEGSVGIYRYTTDGRRVQIQVVNTHRGFIDRVRDVVGCGTISPREPRGLHKGRKTVYHYSLKGSERGLKLLDQILPHLIIKREKAEAIAHELRTRPFGRWANATPEARRAAGERMKRSWQDPEIRARRIAGLRRWRQEVVHRG